jgi:poly(A) polymerase
VASRLQGGAPLGSSAPSADEVAAAAHAALGPDESGWLVGGCLRDELLGLIVHDIDVVLDGAAEPFSRGLADRLGGAVFASSDMFGTWRIVAGDMRVDVAPLRGSTLEKDLTGRDFTIDALARPLAGGEIVDPLGGRDDLAAGRLRLCAPGALDDDPLRVVRLARLAHGLGLEADAAAVRAAASASHALASVSGERLRDELSALLGAADAAAAVRDLSAWGALAVVLPELEALRGVQQNPYHHLDVFDHTLEALTYVRGVVEQLGGASHLASAADAGIPGVLPLVPVSWAVLLHDIGKPAARKIDEQGRVLFWHHDETGREMAAGIATRLKMSNRFAAFLGTLVKQHLRLGFLTREQPLTRRALARYRRDVSPWVFESVVVSLCDRLATRGEKTSVASMARHYRLARSVWSEVSKAPPPRLLSGEDVMALLGLSPGPMVGLALEALDEETEVGEVTTANEARTFLLAWWALCQADAGPSATEPSPGNPVA